MSAVQYYQTGFLFIVHFLDYMHNYVGVSWFQSEKTDL